MKNLEIKENDVFHWRYSQEYIDNLDYKSDLYHCKEKLAVVKNINGELIFCDTFWGIGRSDQYTTIFKQNEIDHKYEVEYYCNLNDLDKKEHHHQIERYYDDKDIFILHDQHSCSRGCIYPYLKKGASRSKDKMLKYLENEISKLQHDIDWKNRQIITARETIDKINNGDIDNIYI